jgi:predicted transcriptional regulator
MNEVRLHITGLDDFFADTRKMAARIDDGDFRQQPSVIACETMEVLLKVLTPNRWTLLRCLRGLGATSIRALSRALGRDYRGVHADVMALLDAGLIERADDGSIIVPWDRITAEMAIDIAA